MTTSNVKVIVAMVIREIISHDRIRAAKIVESIDENPEGILVYLSHGATLGEAEAIQNKIIECGLRIPEQIGNAVIYVTK